jgi:hypothetical protein
MLLLYLPNAYLHTAFHQAIHALRVPNKQDSLKLRGNEANCKNPRSRRFGFRRLPACKHSGSVVRSYDRDSTKGVEIWWTRYKGVVKSDILEDNAFYSYNSIYIE